MAFNLGAALQTLQTGFNPRFADWREKQKKSQQDSLYFKAQMDKMARDKEKHDTAVEKQGQKDEGLRWMGMLESVKDDLNSGDTGRVNGALEKVATHAKDIKSKFDGDPQHTELLSKLLGGGIGTPDWDKRLDAFNDMYDASDREGIRQQWWNATPKEDEGIDVPELTAAIRELAVRGEIGKHYDPAIRKHLEGWTQEDALGYQGEQKRTPNIKNTIMPDGTDGPTLDMSRPENIERMMQERLRITGAATKGKPTTLSDKEKRDLGFPANVVVQRKADGSLSTVYRPSAKGTTVKWDGETLTVDEGGGSFNVPLATGAQTTKERVGARKIISDAQAALEDSSSLMESLRQTPGATGWRGSIVENFGGTIGQIPAIGQTLERSIARVVAGGSPEEVQAIRSQMINQVGAQLSAITGEESGRFTEAERRMAERSLKTIGPEASFPQAISAQKTAMRLNIKALTRARRDLGIPPIFKQDDQESVNAFGRGLSDLGFEFHEITQIINQLIQRETNPILGGSND